WRIERRAESTNHIKISGHLHPEFGVRAACRRFGLAPKSYAALLISKTPNEKRRQAAALQNLAVLSILWNRRIDFARPRVDPAFDAFHVFETAIFEEINRFHRAS